MTLTPSPRFSTGGYTPIRPFQKTMYLRSTEADSSDASGSEAQRGLCELIEKAKPQLPCGLGHKIDFPIYPNQALLQGPRDCGLQATRPGPPRVLTAPLWPAWVLQRPAEPDLHAAGSILRHSKVPRPINSRRLLDGVLQNSRGLFL